MGSCGAGWGGGGVVVVVVGGGGGAGWGWGWWCSTSPWVARYGAAYRLAVLGTEVPEVTELLKPLAAPFCTRLKLRQSAVRW
jgi:hypothetical protein